MTKNTSIAQRHSYVYAKTETLRVSDTDLIGHINNVAFVALCETGRSYFLFDSGIAQLMGGAHLVVARIEIDYRRELHWPASVDVTTAVEHIGRTSFTLANAIFDGDLCAATARTVLVMIGKEERRPLALHADFRALLETHMLSSGAAAS
jgi:acyl-CoA thioester hydrolase